MSGSDPFVCPDCVPGGYPCPAHLPAIQSRAFVERLEREAKQDSTITPRDLFAAAALIGMYIEETATGYSAQRAFVIADAMMAERGKRGAE